MNEICVTAVKENLSAVMEFVDEHLEQLDCPMKAHAQINIAVDELFANIASYAYKSGEGPVTVRVETQDDPIAVILTFVDNGIPYDPLSREEPDVTLSAEDRAIGGLGIFLTRKLMDDVVYSYENGSNILQIKKHI